jgi:hypothetical protein
MTSSDKSQSLHDFHICKNLEIISIEENKGRYRGGFIYEARMKNDIGQGLFYLIDFNHELDLKAMNFRKRENWDYKKWPLEYAILGIVGNGNHKDEIYAYFNGIYRKQEAEWRK